MLKLMIVDDEPVIRNGLQYMIHSENTLFTEIITAADGIEALKLMDEFHPDLLITDIQMPEMDGLELIREAQLKQVKRFVILSGYDHFEYARQALRLKVTDYLLKPIHQKDLAILLTRTAIDIMKERDEAAVRDDDDEDAVAGDHHVSIIKFKAFVQENFMRDLSLEEVASYLELHPNYVCSLLKRETGMTFLYYLRSIRMDQAKEILLKARDVPMDQVARSVGYDNPRHFYKVFKQYEGQTPGRFREENINGFK